jgi:hypothetical protein
MLPSKQLPPLPGDEPSGDPKDPSVFDSGHARVQSERIKGFEALGNGFFKKLTDAKQVADSNHWSPSRRLLVSRQLYCGLPESARAAVEARSTKIAAILGQASPPLQSPWRWNQLRRHRSPEWVERRAPAEFALTGRSFEWIEPHAAPTESPAVPPYLVRQVLELAIEGADVCACPIPVIAEMADDAARMNRWAQHVHKDYDPLRDDGGIYFKSRVGLTLLRLADIAEAERKALAYRSRARTSEPRADNGEYGAEVKLRPDGRVEFRGNQPAMRRRGIKVLGLSSYSQCIPKSTEARLKDGTVLKGYRQKAASPVRWIVKDGIDLTRPVEVPRPKPGPKPIFGTALTKAQKQKRYRDKKRTEKQRSAA